MGSFSLPYLTVLSVVGAIVGLAGSEVTVEVDISETVVVPGNNVTAVCRVNGMMGNFIMYWIKVVEDENGDMLTEMISTNDIISNPYDKTKRYSITMTEAGSVDLFIMHIIKVNVEDTGTYACVVPKANDATGKAKLEVYDNPDSVILNDFQQGVMTFTEGEPMSVQCDVIGGVPAPKVEIILQTSDGEVDYTDSFSQEIAKITRCETSPGDKTCLLHYDYSVLLLNDKFLPQKNENEGKLICKASQPNSGLDAVTAEVTVEVLYPPKFDCSTVVTAKREAKAYEISCEITSNPDIQQVYWAFSPILDVDVITIDKDDTDNTGKYKVFQNNKGSPKTVTSTLRLSEVTKTDFIVYRLVANNSIGAGFIDITLLEDDTSNPGEVIGSSSMTLASIYAVVLGFLVSIISKSQS